MFATTSRVAPAGPRHQPGRATRTGRYADFNLADHVGDDPQAVERNRVTLAATIGVPRRSLIFMNQVHGYGVALVDGPPRGPAPVADALVTATPGLALVVLVADCVPLLLADDEAGVVAAVHAGRRGVALGIAGHAVHAMRSVGAGRVRAAIGPHIGACCYEVGSKLAAEVARDVPATAASTTAGRPSLDLAGGLRAQLAAAGVTDITTDGKCTAEDGSLFSYRRDGVTGRFAGVALLPA